MVRSQRTCDLLGCVFFAVVLCAVSWRTYSMLGVPGPDFDPQVTSMGDFREVVYYPVRAVWEGVNPYDNRIDDDPTRYRHRYPVYNVFPLYSPILFPFALPFSWLPYAAAQIAFWAFNVVLVLMLSAIAWRWAGLECSVARITFLAGCILLSRPGHANLYYGQVTLPVTLATVGALIFGQTRPVLSGLLLAVATLKPTFGGPAGLLMFARGDRKAAVIGLTIAAVVALGGWSAIFLRDAHRQNPIDVLLNNQSDTEEESGARVESTGNRIDTPLVAERLFGRALKPLWRIVLPVAIVLIGAGAVWRLGRSTMRQDPDVRRLSDSLVLVTTAICIYHNVYDALLLVPPIVWATGLSLRTDRRFGRSVPTMAACAFAVPMANYFSSQRFLELIAGLFRFDHALTPEFLGRVWTFVSVLNGTSIFCGWALLVVLANRVATQSESSR